MRSSLILRPSEQVMRLERMGSAFQTRISFMRSLVRRMHREAWTIEQTRFELDGNGFGVAVYSACGPERSYSLVAFANPLDDDQRTDRVIAEAWDASFVLYDGVPSDEDIARLKLRAPRQEAGRFEGSELVLSRANRSMRLFDYVCTSLAAGVQPDITRLTEVGYLMRTTAVYGNGKFGVGDRAKIAGRPELAGPFQAELLTVYLIRCFTLDQVEHVAKAKSSGQFVPLERSRKRFLGIGNATGLGMAPFLITHPELIHRWAHARENALARVRQVIDAAPEKIDRFQVLLTRARKHLDEWQVEDSRQWARILETRSGVARIREWISVADSPLVEKRPWDRLYQMAEARLSVESQEFLVSLLIELYPELVDELETTLSSERRSSIDASQSMHELRSAIEKNYRWALEIDFERPGSQQHFWYTSANKLEPRFGDRYSEAGADREMPLAIARDVQQLYRQLTVTDDAVSLAQYLLSHPEHRHVVRRIQANAIDTYGEIQDNLIDEDCLPLHLLRYKLAFFGASKFDPKSSLWTRITLFQGAPLPDELHREDADDWCFPVAPTAH